MVASFMSGKLYKGGGVAIMVQTRDKGPNHDILSSQGGEMPQCEHLQQPCFFHVASFSSLTELDIRIQ